MARHPRLDLPDVPQHIVQRGNNRCAIFFEDAHRRFFLALLRQATRAAEVALHAYVLMTNHVHLLMTPRYKGSVSAVMQQVGRRYVQSLNAITGRTGSLYGGRFKSHLVQSERYLLCCYRYIELNPVRAGMVPDPGSYPWSSHRHNAWGEPDDLIVPHPVFLELGNDGTERAPAYRAFVSEGTAPAEADLIRAHLKQGGALGEARFQAEIERLTGRRASLAQRGRPPRKNGSDPYIF